MFLETDDGFINLDYVRNIKHSANGGLLCYDTHGNFMAACDAAADIEMMVAPVVPAEPGQVALVICAFNDEDEVVLHSEIKPIVAWRLFRGCAVPVMPDILEPDYAVLIKMQDGKFLYPGMITFDSQEKAEEYFVRRQKDILTRNDSVNRK